MSFSKTIPANLPSQAFPSHLSLIFYNCLSSISYLSYSSLIHPLPNPVSSSADFRQELERIHKGMKTLWVFAPRRGPIRIEYAVAQTLAAHLNKKSRFQNTRIFGTGKIRRPNDPSSRLSRIKLLRFPSLFLPAPCQFPQCTGR
jgi:hypothetical protein